LQDPAPRPQGQAAQWTSDWLVDPNSIPVNPPCPWQPTTSWATFANFSNARVGRSRGVVRAEKYVRAGQ
jgi:hypothetical protein